MLKSILVLDPKYDPAKQIYTLGDCKIKITKPTPLQISFDNIQYTHEGVHHNIIYDLVNSMESNSQVTLNVFYNGSSHGSDQNINTLLKDVIQLKMLSNIDGQFAHFDLRNGQVCDYNRNIQIGNIKAKTQESVASHQRQGTDLCELEIFDEHNKQSIKSASISQIQKYLRFVRLRKDCLGHIFIAKKQSQFVSSRINNEFYILRFGKKLKIVILNILSSKYQCLSNLEDKQFRELLLLKKHAITRKVEFISLLGKVTSKIMERQKSYQLNYLISYFPCLNNNLDIANLISSEQSYTHVGKVLDGYTKQKSNQVTQQINCMETQIFNLKLQKKIQQENIGEIMNRYKKSFERLAQSLSFLKKNSISNINKYTNWIEKQIASKKVAVQEQQTQLKQLNTQLIKAAQNQDYFYKKLKEHRDRIIRDNGQARSLRKRTMKHVSLKKTQNQQPSSNNNLKQVHLYDQHAKMSELEKCKQKILIDLQQRISQLDQRKQFMKIIAEVKSKIPTREFTKIQQRYYDLIQD